MKVTRTFDLLNRYQENFDKEDALVAKESGKWVKYTTRQYIDYAYAFSYGLLALGIKKGDKIVTVSNNRPEWNFVDMGMAMIGVVHVPVLPLCHVGGRMGNYQTQYSGTSIYYAENMGAIAANMREIKPDGFDAVPRILEKIYDTVISKGKKLTQPKKSIFFWAVKLGLKYKDDGDNSWFYNRKLKIADKLIFIKWREALGGNIRLVGCGGASLQPRLERIFWACGIKVLNMYGLTETSPIITINKSTIPDFKLGTVGKLIEGVDVKIADDGEILCKGHNVMLGYYKDQELTKSVFDEDGWFHTGDIGSWDKDKFLKVTDRKKEIFKLSNGKFIAPQIIENKIKESIFIDQIMVTGEHEKFVTRSHKNPWRKPARELPCGKIRILLRNHYLIIFVCALMLHGSFIVYKIKKAQGSAFSL